MLDFKVIQKGTQQADITIGGKDRIRNLGFDNFFLGRDLKIKKKIVLVTVAS